MDKGSFEEKFAAHDWAATPLGPIESWPSALAGPVGYLLKTPQPVFFVAGPEMVLLFNESFRGLIGERWGEALGQSVRELWRPVWPRIGPLLERAYRGESFVVRDMAFPTWTSGFTEERYYSLAFTSLLDRDNRVVATCCSCNDTTDTVLRSRRAVEQRDAMLRHLDDSPSFALATEGPEHRIIYANSSFERLTRRKIRIGAPAHEMFPESLTQGVIEILDHVLTSGESISLARQPYAIEAPDGAATVSTVSLVYEPLYGASGEITGTMILGTDHSTEVATERKVESLEAELIQATRLAAVNALGSTLAHELNQPLAAIANNAATATLLLDGLDVPSDELRECIADIGSNALRAGAVIRGLREMLDQGPSRRESVALAPRVRAVLRLVSALAQPDARIEVDVAPDMIVLGDPTQIEQVLLNLLKNAFEAVDGRGSDIRIAATRIGSLIELEVCDNGSGLAPGQAERLFRPLPSAKPGGLGLGLSICRLIVEAHGGTIAARPGRAGGTCFAFTLPVASSPGRVD